MGDEGEQGVEDPRMNTLKQYCLKTMKMKNDKWSKMLSQDENTVILTEFLEKGDCRLLIIYINSQGQISPTTTYPGVTKSKAVYFVKRQSEPVKKDNFHSLVVLGDLSNLPLELLTSLIETLVVPMVANDTNHIKWPKVVSQDLTHHIGGLKGEVFTFSGQVKGKTLLPLPHQADAELVAKAIESELRGVPYDKALIHIVEGVVIEWSHKVNDVLKKSSAQPLLEGKNPGPLVEIEFWIARRADLESVVEQLCNEKVLKMSRLLEKTLSSYYPAYCSMLKTIDQALEEARDISMHLKPLRRLIEGLEECEFLELEKRILALYHVICLIWANSTHYQKHTRLIVLMQEVTNFIIEQAHNFASEEILRMEPDEGLEKVADTLKICCLYRDTYFTKKSGLRPYFKDRPVVEWNFQASLIFSRLDRFIDQLKLIEEFFLTVTVFLRLEKIQFGGIKGQSLSDLVEVMFNEFNDLTNGFMSRPEDPLDISNNKFTEAYGSFKAKMTDIEKRLAQIVCSAFDECSNCESIFKLFEMMGPLLEKPLIDKDFRCKYPVLLSMYSEELDRAKVIYDRQMVAMQSPSGPVVNKNMPRVAGLLKWSQELTERISNSMEKLKQINHGTIESAEAMIINSKFDEMGLLIHNFEEEIYSEWTQSVDAVASENLDKPLLVRKQETHLITVNFDPKLVALLRDVKYLNQQDRPDRELPSSVANIFQQNETYRNYLQNLDVVVALYNNVRETILDVEYPLIEQQLLDIDKQLERAITEINWTSSEAWEYIQSTRDRVCDLERRVRLAKANVVAMCSTMAGWSKTPLYRRKGDKKDSFLNLEDRETNVKSRCDVVRADGEKIHTLIKENMEHFKATEDSDDWKHYIEYLDDLLVDGFFECVSCSLKYLLENMDKGKTSAPLMEAKFELQAPELVFRPSLEPDSLASFISLVESLLDDMFNFTTLIPRLAAHKGMEHYHSDVEDIAELSEMRDEILTRVNSVISQGTKYKDSYNTYSYLWVDDRQSFLEQFLLYGHVLTQEDIEQAGDEGVPENPPTLDKFRKRVDSYEAVYLEVEKFEETKVVDTWFSVDTRPFKHALLTIIKKWSFMFKQHLIDHVINSLSDLSEFIKVTSQGLGAEVIEEADYDGLVVVIGHLIAIKDRQPNTDNMFDPLKQTIELLSSYGQEMPDEVHQQLEELPEEWNNVKKQSSVMKQTVAPLQAEEVNRIRRELITFDVRQHEFREEFRKMAPFNYSSTHPYVRIDKIHHSLTEKEMTMQEFHKAALLFEVNTPEFKQLKACRKEICMLKVLWDQVELVRSSFADWNKTLWSDINVENMEMDCKKFVKDIRTLDREMRAWDAFTGLDSTVKNMVTSLRAVGELQNQAIRDRHWEQLMQATQVKFLMSDETNLADLLALNLHKFEDEVRNIVDKATKELSMEKTLAELKVTWSQMEFENEMHTRTQYMMLKSSEELIETLEDNQVQLQNMMTSKFVGYFIEQVSDWQKKLSNADSVISIWFEVQQTWSHLESIFIGSEDIRAQLPEHSKEFDNIDADFKVLMKEAERTPNVVKATNRPKLYKELENIQERLSVCEKALAEYLETKRLAFPRFYFISSSDLLDILSKGNQPVKVARHLAKLFDSMASLKFEEDATGEPTKNAVGMYSKDKEYVDFDEPCQCVGQVESWLNALLDRMVATIRHNFMEAVISYEEKPREQWIFDPPAQIALAGTQVWWTTEVQIAFSRLEEGYETAVKDYYKKQVNQLITLINLLLGDLSKANRQRIMTICTIDVHARDVVAKIVAQKVDSAQAFLWLSQLRHRWSDTDGHCYANICDAQFKYSYEYLGNTARLVITPLTDRCYITLTQSLHLTMSGAPAGPAGTGKTETTKDLGRALGIMVYVFNCSEQMDYKSIGNIYKGLSQTGAWGCFDEFNRISVEVLSVVAVQVKTIQDAIKDKKKRFIFQGCEISLTPTVGLFITMNPGYAGRTELPENLKTLFRPCAMVVPDYELIAEIMLVAEGFVEARILARKFLTLYTLCAELLSKQDHYDWGLRAIKSVLVVAGALKRGDRKRPEDQVLMRALRDFNLPKIITEDVAIIMGLIGDLFPALDVPRKRDMDFEDYVKKAVVEQGLQAEDHFVLKVVQLEELRHVRHSIFVIGNAGTGKSKILRSLNRTYALMGQKPIWVDINPKAVTTFELFGFINPATREWKDGLYSSIMRDLAYNPSESPKWIVIDGDVDPMWIESLNTVMDDNKVLTLASNERVPLTNSMRLMFETGHLKYANLSTVSRAGILFVNPSDLGWNPYVQSWIDKREVQSEKANLTILFERYLPVVLEAHKVGRFKKITPIQEVSMIQTLCYLLETLLTPENTPPDTAKDIYELYFVFAAIWAFGGFIFKDELVDYRVEFTKWWVAEFKHIKFPSQGTLFDYFLDHETKKWMPWAEKVPTFTLDPEIPLQAVLVHNPDTVRFRYFLDLLMAKRRPVMLVSNAGLGKTVLINDKLNALDSEETLVTTIPLNYYTNSLMLQQVMEKPLEKKAGRNFGPPGTKKLVYLIDDMNMPEVDTYGTVQPHTLIRQHLDYSHWYDRTKQTLKEVLNVQYVASMNPTAGSFTINTRLQRHFSVFAISFPGQESLKTIYQSIFSGHISQGGFSSQIQKSVEKIVNAALELHQKVATLR